jgi:hypothetical protein
MSGFKVMAVLSSQRRVFLLLFGVKMEIQLSEHLVLDDKNSKTDAQKVEFQFSPPKMVEIPLFGLFRVAIT